MTISSNLNGVTQLGSWTFSLNAAIPAGGNVIGGVTQSGAWAVSVSNLPALGPQPSAGSSSVVIASDQSPVNIQAPVAIPVVNDPAGQGLTVTLAGSDINSVVNPITIAGTVPVSGAFWPGTQPVSAPAPLPTNLSQAGGLALSAANPLPVQLSDGSQSSDLASALRALTTIEVIRLQREAAQFGAAGFIPVEIPSFLGA